jgi:hypothetical protein
MEQESTPTSIIQTFIDLGHAMEGDQYKSKLLLGY